MPKDPKRNIQRYKVQGGHLNEFEFQKHQSEMTEEPELPFAVETENQNLSQSKRVAEVMAEAHQEVEKRRRLGIARAPGRKSRVARKTSAKKTAKKPATRKVTKKRASVKNRRASIRAK